MLPPTHCFAVDTNKESNQTNLAFRSRKKLLSSADWIPPKWFAATFLASSHLYLLSFIPSKYISQLCVVYWLWNARVCSSRINTTVWGPLKNCILNVISQTRKFSNATVLILGSLTLSIMHHLFFFFFTHCNIGTPKVSLGWPDWAGDLRLLISVWVVEHESDHTHSMMQQV